MIFLDRKSTRLNSSHVAISYAVFCLNKKKNDYYFIFFLFIFFFRYFLTLFCCIHTSFIFIFILSLHDALPIFMKNFTFLIWLMILFFAVNVFSKENPSEIRGFNSPLTDIKITVNDIFDEVAGSSVHYEMMSLTEDGCEIPNLEVETPAPICEGGNTTITVTTDGEEVNWYDDEAAENLIHTGLTFTTPELAETTSYWVQALNYGEGEEGEFTGGGRVAPTGNSGSSVVALTSPWGLSFDTTEDFTINSVDVFLTSSSPGDLVVQLLDENWELIEETTVSCPAGNFSNPVQYELPLDFEVEADNTYRLAAVSGPAMIREFSTEHPGFPYPIGDVGSITGGTINSSDSNDTVYYFFYNWTVTADDVETDRKSVV